MVLSTISLLPDLPSAHAQNICQTQESIAPASDRKIGDAGEKVKIISW
jgi:hypothetical protein